ncbi:MAG TPA: FAD-linked oxidase C-terminal domain-containing protein [Bacteroidales bacterium]|nr:FAD-linked oxidase C-terminal domain-containing protein [Bacteroidales bacterium]
MGAEQRTSVRESKLYKSLKAFEARFSGEILVDESTRLIYATDASVYREKPLAVAFPRSSDDIRRLIAFAAEHKTSLIPRAAGTSLAGQVVGNGIVVDISRHMGAIIELNKSEKWVKVQPGVVLNELNKFLAPHGLFFGPETSTADYCMIGGMVGNNACGAHSLVYGSTRDHTLEITALLADGSEVVFGDLSPEQLQQKLSLPGLEGDIYRKVHQILSDQDNRELIHEQYPDPRLKRRNTGYALDLLAQCRPYNPEGPPLNLSRLLAGSEGTLAFVTGIKLNLVDLPPKHKALVCAHFHTLEHALHANLIALKYQPVAIELMDKTVMDLTRENIEQNKNRYFVQGDPAAILIVEFAENEQEKISEKAGAMEREMRSSGYGFHFPIVTGSNIKKVWELRKAGLGILNNMPGDAKPVAVIEDAAVHPEYLPDYIADISAMLHGYGKDCVYYAHIATGELHLRPVLNLKDQGDVELFHNIARDTAAIVKKYRGSLSGEHGDGRLRGQFIPFMLGEHIYELFKDIKKVFDPHNIFNPNKIVATPPMNSSLRYVPGQSTRQFETIFDFSRDEGMVRAAEKCNGTAQCRKTEVIGGTMCPSYMATRNEKDSTRARANLLREILSDHNQANPFASKELYDILDLCLSCKACKSECPSSVDMTKLKAEFLQHYYDAHGVPFRSLLIAHFGKLNHLGAYFPSLTNFLFSNQFTSSVFKRIAGFAPKRSIPRLHKQTLADWSKSGRNGIKPEDMKGRVLLFNDEFTNYNDTPIGIKAIILLERLGVEVVIPKHLESARTYLSKGLLRQARNIARTNVSLLADIVSDERPLIGIEPSAILSFRDEYPELVGQDLRRKAEKLAKNVLTVEEYIASLWTKGKIDRELFESEERTIFYHGHCQQKAISSTNAARTILSIPAGWTVHEIPSGCCGMAGSFGYEKEHFEVSMKIGELVLFPAVRNLDDDAIISASGTSCRHQIADGTGKNAMHPVELLFEALI